MLLNLLQPLGDVVEGLLLGAIVHEDDSHGALVVSLGNCAESFLPSGVPNLEFDSLILDVDCLDFEIDACESLSAFFHLPMVGMWLVGKLFSEKRSSMQLLPTLLSPMMISLMRWS